MSKGSSKAKDFVYLDHNGTTLICEPAKKAYLEWISCYNVSSGSRASKPAAQAVERATDYILKEWGVSSADYTLIYTSGSTESNCLILRACVKAYRKKLQLRGELDMLPHIIVSAVEHHSVIECVNDMVEHGACDVSFVQPTMYGSIIPADVQREFRPNTCLVSIMFANNEIPVINNIAKIGMLCHENKIPLHSDGTAIFGKYKFNIKKNCIDALSFTAHKFNGPKGAGGLFIANNLITGYGLTAEINGSQQHGLRGGTVNVPAIMSMQAAIVSSFASRQKKNARLFALRDYLIEKLNKEFHLAPYERYVEYYNKVNLAADKDESGKFNDVEIVILGPPQDCKSYVLCSTVLLAICKNRGRPFCNVKLKQYLETKNIIISIGSACLTQNAKASHVLTAIGAPDIIKRGVLRISMGVENTMRELDFFCDELHSGIKKQNDL